MMRTIRRTMTLAAAGLAMIVGLTAGAAQATPRAASPVIPVHCTAINLGANVSNLGVGYAFNARCDPKRPIVVQAQWYDAAGAVLGDASTWMPGGDAGVWTTFSGNLQRAVSPKQTTYACVWVTQDALVWNGGPLLAFNCFPRNS